MMEFATNRPAMWTVPTLGRALCVLAVFAVAAPLPECAPAQEDAYRLPYSDRLLLAFAQVQQLIDAIEWEYSERIREASDSEERERIVAEANALAAKAVAESTLSYDQYSRIATDMRHDPELRSRIRFLIRRLERAYGTGRGDSPSAPGAR